MLIIEAAEAWAGCLKLFWPADVVASQWRKLAALVFSLLLRGVSWDLRQARLDEVIVVANWLTRLCARLFRLTAIEQGVNGCVDGVM